MKVEKITPQIAALYLGQKCEYKSKEHPLQHGVITPLVIDLLQDRRIYITPHLRRIESLTEEEARELIEMFNGGPVVYGGNLFDLMNVESSIMDEIIGNPPVWIHLLSKGFDLFGLIDSGLAKDVNA